MTSKPKLRLGRELLPGLGAVALFAVFAYTFVTAEFGDSAGFPGGESITENIGLAMFDMASLQTIPAEGFLVSFIVIAIALDAALEGAVMLAKREEDGAVVNPLKSDAEEEPTAADGGRPGGED
ncbi:NADH-quinone oxidoreductase subunit J [Halostella litorea]|uniref:NADH-quinone oxidoreductase subunit J n=1 Tax=Halostella litorea TaxID=2528831 RepID=UPI001092EB7F|nr:NADH-quinone oxidoreductase subunit J [Halostella litorea]